MSNTNTMQPGLRRSLIPSLSLTSIAIATALSTIPISPSAANASATGCDGGLCHRIIGHAKTIVWQKADYNRPICDWRIDFVYNRNNGKGFRRDKGKTRSCGFPKRVVTNDKKLKHSGKACAVLFSKGRKIARQCHTIKGS